MEWTKVSGGQFGYHVDELRGKCGGRLDAEFLDQPPPLTAYTYIAHSTPRMTGGHHHRATLKQVSSTSRMLEISAADSVEQQGIQITPFFKRINQSCSERLASRYSQVNIKLTSSGKIASPSASHKPAKNVSSSSKKARINAQAQKRELKRRNVGEDIKFFSTSSGGSESCYTEAQV